MSVTVIPSRACSLEEETERRNNFEERKEREDEENRPLKEEDENGVRTEKEEEEVRVRKPSDSRCIEVIVERRERLRETQGGNVERD